MYPIKICNVIWLLIFLPGLIHAYSLIIERADPWFIMEVNIDPSTLPAEITFNPDAQTLINNTDIPLYVVRATKKPQDWIGKLPGNVLPLFKAVSNTAYSFSFERGEWFKINQRYIEGRSIGGIDLFKALTPYDYNKLIGIRGPGRPHNVKLPEPNTVIIQGFYGSKKINLEVTIYYKISEKYTGDRWFAFDNLKVNKEQIPPGIDINPIPVKYNPGERFLYEINNSSDTPFYIVKEFHSPFEWLGVLPTNVLPEYMLKSGNSYNSNDIQNQRSTDVWNLNQNRPMLQVTPRLIEQLLNIDFRYLDKREDCRPEKVEIPEPQPFEITMYYGETRHQVKGDVIIKLNENYNPLAGSPDINSCAVYKQKDIK